MTAEKTKEVEKMISKVEKKKDLSRAQAIDYMLGVATGRLNALWRYDDSLPVGKQTKGILQISGKKKRAPKVARISVLPLQDDTETPRKKPKKQTKAAPSAKNKSAKPTKKSAKKSPAAKKKRAQEAEATAEQEIAAAE